MSEIAGTDVGTLDGHPDVVLPLAWRVAAERGGPAIAVARCLPDRGHLDREHLDREHPDREHPDPADVRIVWANPAALDLLGLGAGALDGVALLEAAPRHQRGQSWPVVATSLLGGPGGHATGVVRRPDESTHRVEVQVVPLPGGWLVRLSQHVDEARAARTAAADAEHRFRALAEHAPVGIFLSEAGLRLGYVNGPFAELLGTDPGALAGTAWLDAINPDDKPELLESLHAVLSGQEGEVRVRLTVPVASQVPAARTPASRIPAARSDAEPADAARPAQRWLHLRLAPTTTPSRAAGFVGTAEDVTVRQAWEAKISYQAHHDPLTGLVNRRRLVTVLSELLASRRGADHSFAVLFFDLDGFKEVNDTFGHDAGDRVLVEVARRMQRTAREYDVIARIAGDEFVVVLRNVATAAEAEAAGTRHLAALAAPVTVAGRELMLSASLGIALPATFDTPETLLRAADRVMYDAKAAGPGHYRLAAAAAGIPAEPMDDEPEDRS
jgi:diguanylate cyclase (GGDEF)-like protein